MNQFNSTAYNPKHLSDIYSIEDLTSEIKKPTLPLQQINDLQAFQTRVQLLLEKHLAEKQIGIFFNTIKFDMQIIKL